MTNEELLFNLVSSRDENSVLVAQDLAIELNCGIPNQCYSPIQAQYVYALRYVRLIKDRTFSTRKAQSGLCGYWRSYVEIEEYKDKVYYSNTGYNGYTSSNLW